MKNNGIMRIAGNEYIFSVVVKILMLIIGVLHSAFLARFLGPELKGVAATITSTVALSQVIITCGIHQAYPYFKRQGKIENLTNIFTNNVYFIYALLFMIIVVLSFFFRGVFSQKTIFILLLTPIFAYENIVSYIYLIEKPLKKNSWSLLSSFAETVLIIFLWLFVKPNIFYMILAISAAIFIRAISSTVGVHAKLNIKLISIKFIAKMLRFGIMPMIALILTVMNSKIDVLMMDWGNVVTTASIGLYSVGIGIADKILAIPDAIREILLSKLVSGKSEQEVARVTRISFFFCLIMAGAVALLGGPFLNVFYGAEYAGAYSVLVISSCGTAFMVFLKMISQYNIVHKRQLANLLMLAISVVTNVCFNLILIPHYGIDGAAIASFIGHLVCAVCFIIYFSKVAHIRFAEILFPKKEDFEALLHRRNKK